MNTATKEKAKAMLNAGVDKDTIIETLNISLNDLENIDGNEPVEKPTKVASTTPHKITADNYDYYKNFISSWTGNIRDCFEELGISCPTFYRIQRTNSFEEYRDYSKSEREKYLGHKIYKRVFMTKERFDAIKLGLSTWKGTDASYRRTVGISQATLYRVKKAKDYDEYSQTKKAMRDAYVARTALDEQTAEAAKPVVVERKRKQERKLGRKQVDTTVDVLKRIADQLERLADYEQMKLSKKRWFRK